MSYDPLSQVIDEPLSINGAVLEQLAFYRASPKLALLPGVDPSAERERLSAVLDDLTDTLVKGVAANPSKLWVMQQFQHALQVVQFEETEGREHFGMELEQIMDLLHIDSSDGLLNFYLVGF